MTAATKKAPARKPAEKSSLDYLQQALDDLRRTRASRPSRRRARASTPPIERIREVRKDLGARAHERGGRHADPPRARVRRRAA